MKKYNWLYNDCINMGETFNLLKDYLVELADSEVNKFYTPL